MKGLMIKDFLSLKRQGRVLFVMLAIYIMFGAFSKNISMLCGMTVMICAMMPITTLSYDEKSKWDKYALSMPIPRQTIVLSKYIFGVLLILAGIAFVIPISLLISSFTGEMVIKDILLTVLATAGAAVLFLAIMLPLLFKFGVEKARILIMLVIFIPIAALMILYKLGVSAPSEQMIKHFISFSPIVLILVLLISAAISVAIYNRKEF